MAYIVALIIGVVLAGGFVAAVGLATRNKLTDQRLREMQDDASKMTAIITAVYERALDAKDVVPQLQVISDIIEANPPAWLAPRLRTMQETQALMQRKGNE